MRKTTLLLSLFLALGSAHGAFADQRVEHVAYSHALPAVNGVTPMRTISSGTLNGKTFNKMTIHTPKNAAGVSSSFSRGNYGGDNFYKTTTTEPARTEFGIEKTTVEGELGGTAFKKVTTTAWVPKSMGGGTAVKHEGTELETP